MHTLAKPSSIVGFPVGFAFPEVQGLLSTLNSVPNEALFYSSLKHKPGGESSTATQNPQKSRKG